MKRSFWRSIRGKLIRSTLPLVLLPLLALGSIAIASVRSLKADADSTIATTRDRLGQDVVGPKVQAVADQISRELGYFLSERILDAYSWSTSAALVAAAEGSTVSFAAAGLLDRSDAELEAAYLAGALPLQALPADPSSSFTELFFTDVNGLTVASNTRTSDFVQNDEEWWIEAWENGVHVSTVEWDESAEVVSVDISLRIDAPDGRGVGVMKAVLDVANVQAVSNRFVGDANQYQVTVTDQRGLLLAETASEHDQSRLMNPEQAASRSTNPRVARALSSAGNIFTIDEEAVAGFAQANRVIAADRNLATDAAARTLKLAFDWRVIVEQPIDVAFAPVESLDQINSDIEDSSRWLSLVLAAGVGSTSAAALLIIWFLSRRITRPIEQLSSLAAIVAEESLPAVVARIEQLGEHDELPVLEEFSVNTGDEVEALAAAFNAMQQTATRLAVEQAQQRRRNVSKTFVSLGRRNQNLLTRQLEHLDEMERSETDPDTLRQLFRLDHLVTRMRRNAESLLVLAGEDAPRRFRRPVSVQDVIQAAAAEIEDFQRIEVVRVDPGAIDGASASAVAHLLAELLENAGRFSAPATRIQVEGRVREHGFTVSIMDQGIGMTAEELLSANERLSNPMDFDRAPSAYLGLFVVGHLARRHGIHVQLTHSPFDGIVAKIDLPSVILVDPAVLVLPASEPVLAQPVLAQPVPVQPVPIQPVARPPEHRPVSAAQTGAPEQPELTPSGFRRRRRGTEGAPEPQRTGIDEGRRQPRDPQAVGAFLANFRSGVNHGRIQVSASESFAEPESFERPKGGTHHA